MRRRRRWLRAKREDIIDAVVLAPLHELLAAEAGVGPQNDLRPRPTRPDLRDDAFNLLHAARAGVLIGLPQPHAQDLISGEDIERQVAVVVVVAVKEPALLLAMQRRVGGVQIDDDPFGRLDLRLQIHLHQQPVDGRGVVADLLVAVLGGASLSRALQTAQRGLAGQRFARLAFASQQAHQRIIAKLVVVIEIRVAQRQRVDALRHHFSHAVLDSLLAAEVGEAACQARQQPDPTLGAPQQQRTGIRRHSSTVETRHDTP